ncbi:MAG TPA: STAS domain-containing protein [Dongiaceae bacterium]|nr:STAS domain-containing protein [Dongiaceae bacterium]
MSSADFDRCSINLAAENWHCRPRRERGYWRKRHNNTMEIRKTITNQTHELMVSGRIDGAGANELEVEILAAMRAGAATIYVNLSQTTFLCSAGLRVLLQYWRQMKNSQRLLQATRPSPEVAAVLAATGFQDLVEKI